MNVLVTQFYKPENEDRFNEIKYCLKRNIENSLIDIIAIHVKPSDIQYLEESKKIKIFEVADRATYQCLFDSESLIGEGLIIIANSDIFIEEDAIKLCLKNIRENQAYALSRWDLDEDMKAKHHNTWDSQDAWIFKNSIKAGNYDIPLGIPGCDNRIAYELKEAGYEVINPSKRVKTYHYHLSNYRSYKEIDRLEGGFYCITPGGIEKEKEFMKTNLNKITAVCIDGRELSPETKERYKLIMTYMLSKVDFYEMKFFGTTDPEVPGVNFTQISPIDIGGYSRFCIFELTKAVDSEYCLIFQDDGFIVNPELWEDSFYNYDWIGSPWPLYMEWPKEGYQVGNGGFSLRSKKLLQWTSTLTDWAGQNEDAFIVSGKKEELENQGLKIAPVEVATRFSVENEMTREHGLHNVFGFHAKNKMDLALEKIKKQLENK